MGIYERPQNPTFPQIYSVAMLGATIGLFLAFFFNNFTKISAHATGVGGLLGIILIIIRWFSYSYFYIGAARITVPIYWVLIVVLLLCGIVCTARLLLKAHEPKDILQGFIVGVLGMWVAAWYLI
jgi:membrane-associated phospholipid phosphatase